MLQTKQGYNIGGLLPLPKDERDFEHSRVFGSLSPKKLPDEYVVGSPVIKDQGNTDMCASFSSTSVSEDQEGVELSPEFTFYKVRQILGDGWGSDLRTPCKVHVKIGALEEKDNPYPLGEYTRDQIADGGKWNKDLDILARVHRKSAYFSVGGGMDTFDNFRSAMYLAKDEMRSLMTGVMWRYEWTFAEKGIISTTPTEGILHSIKVFGWKQINGEPYLMIQNSAGKEVGDNGVYYFNRETVNRDFVHGAFMFRDLDKEVAKKINKLWFLPYCLRIKIANL